MSRDEAFQFMRLGRNIERADMTSRVLDVGYAVNLPFLGSQAVLNSNQADLVWMSVLHALSAHQMYRRHVGVHAKGYKVIHYLLNDPRFPRSVRHCLVELQSSLAELPGEDAQQPAILLLRQLDTADGRKLAESGLHAFCDRIQAGLAELSVAIAQTYFRAAYSDALTQKQFNLT
jgi:uncharacterized alpha-E superfamily protein